MNLDPIVIRAPGRARAFLLLAAFSVQVSVEAQDQSAQLVKVMVDQSVSIPFAGVSHALVVNENICRLEIDAGMLRVFGLARGETVVLAWRNAQPESLIVRVMSAPFPRIEDRPTQGELDAVGHGSVGRWLT